MTIGWADELFSIDLLIVWMYSVHINLYLSLHLFVLTISLSVQETRKCLNYFSMDKFDTLPLFPNLKIVPIKYHAK